MSAKPSIVILDAHTVNPGDLSWDPFHQLGKLQIYPRSGEQRVTYAKDAEIIVSNKELLGRKEISQLPKLRFISVLATGTNIIDLKAASEAGITVSNVPGYSTESVVQQIWSLIFGLNNRVSPHHQDVTLGNWQKSLDFSYCLSPYAELFGKKIAIIGLGNIGKRLAATAHAMGLRVITPIRANRESISTISANVGTIEHSAKLQIPLEYLPLEELFSQADILCLCCPLTAETKWLIDKKRLSLMKKSALIINTGRGDLVDETALAEAIRHQKIAGAGLDVLSTEPPSAQNPLIQLAQEGAPNLLICPHIAWASIEARQRLIQATFDNIQQFLLGTPINTVTA